MPVSDFLKASGVKVHQGETGTLYHHLGTIKTARPSKNGIDSSLYAVLKMAVDALHISVVASSWDTGKHTPNSRHYKGTAVDIYMVGDDEQSLKPATLDNRAALRLFFWLRSSGFRIGERVGGQAVPGLLFGGPLSKYNPSSVDHLTHMHVGIPGPYKKAAGV